ncbi:MAG: hypothetical protein KDD50_14730 [Bdellovibrionales bacterium]|nr:hypothetical protein [Bdellovibrionales bacterium]
MKLIILAIMTFTINAFANEGMPKTIAYQPSLEGKPIQIYLSEIKLESLRLKACYNNMSEETSSGNFVFDSNRPKLRIGENTYEPYGSSSYGNRDYEATVFFKSKDCKVSADNVEGINLYLANQYMSVLLEINLGKKNILLMSSTNNRGFLGQIIDQY